MRYFRLPDLGEGLPEAEILEWHVQEGDQVETDQVLVSVETAKAVLEVPSPQNGIIAHIFGAPGDTIHTGEPLLEFADSEADDSGTVVGNLRRDTGASAGEEQFFIGAAPGTPAWQPSTRRRISPVAQALARRLQLDPNTIPARDAGASITASDVERAARLSAELGDAEPLRGVRKQMARNLAAAHAQVVSVTLHDDADIDHWPSGTDLTLRLIQALAHACRQAPALNAWLDGEHLTRRLHEELDLGVAVDTEQGLFVPVLRRVGSRSAEELRQGLDRLRADVQARSIPAAEMQGATLTLSNFGMLGGRYANPVVVPPQVAILGAGRARQEAVVVAGQVVPRRRLPLSLTFDHRAATGAEAAHFLQSLIEHLQS